MSSDSSDDSGVDDEGDDQPLLAKVRMSKQHGDRRKLN
jgi:hypothetical protein